MRPRDEIDQHHGVAKRLRESGQMSSHSYQKCILGLAHEHALNKHLEDARLLISECEESYLRDILPDQMKDDPVFGDTVHDLAQRLAARGVPSVDPDEVLLAFSKAGTA